MKFPRTLPLANPWTLLGALVVMMGLYGGGIWRGKQIERNARIAESVQETIRYEEDQRKKAEYVEGLKREISALKADLEKEVKNEDVYSNCRLTHNGERLLRDAYEGPAAKPSRDRELPGANPADRR